MSIWDRVCKIFSKGESDDDEEVRVKRLEDLKEGWMFNYNTDSWIVQQILNCTLGDNEYLEFQASSGEDGSILHVEYRHEEFIRVYRNVIAEEFHSGIRQLLKEEKPPKVIKQNGLEYLLNAVGSGSQLSKSEFTEEGDVEEGNEEKCFLFWEYITKDEEDYVRFEQWDDNDFTCCVGIFEQPQAFEVLGDTK